MRFVVESFMNLPGSLTTFGVGFDQSVIFNVLPHLHSMLALVRFEPIISRDVMAQLRFARVVGHVAFFDEQVEAFHQFLSKDVFLELIDRLVFVCMTRPFL